MNSANRVTIAHNDLCRFIMGVQKMDMNMLNSLADKVTEMSPWLDESESRFMKAVLGYIGDEYIMLEEEERA